MLTKINRDDCLKDFPDFPLRHYDEVLDDEVCYYPKVFANQWLKVASNDKNERTELLASELSKLMKLLGYSKFVFLGDTDRCWISELSLERNDYAALNEAKLYLASNKVDKDFNGGVQVEVTDLPEFLRHFYCLTSCDASLPYFYFMDLNQNIIGFIHYSGEVKIDTLNKRTQQLLEDCIKETAFAEVVH
jgi:hypothetical protein